MHAWRAATKQDGGGVGVSARSCLGGGGAEEWGGGFEGSLHLAKEAAFIILASVGPRPSAPPTLRRHDTTRRVAEVCVGDGE